MGKRVRLTKHITEAEFDHGYWYADEIKAFAKQLGIPNSAKLRKDELEKLIRQFIRTGKVHSSRRKNITKTGVKDHELGLTPSLTVNHYTSNKQTKEFIEREALKINPGLKQKSGARYRLNRWRDEQVSKGNKITYGDLINEYIRLNQRDEPFEKIAHGRYINFMAEYLKKERNATRRQAITAWEQLKSMDAPKDYQSWKKFRNR